MYDIDQPVGMSEEYPDPAAAAAKMPGLDGLLRAWEALDIPDREAARALAADQSVPEMDRRVRLVARMQPWLEALWRNVSLAPWFLARRLRGAGFELERAGTAKTA